VIVIVIGGKDGDRLSSISDIDLITKVSTRSLNRTCLFPPECDGNARDSVWLFIFIFGEYEVWVCICVFQFVKIAKTVSGFLFLLDGLVVNFMMYTLEYHCDLMFVPN